MKIISKERIEGKLVIKAILASGKEITTINGKVVKKELKS